MKTKKGKQRKSALYPIVNSFRGINEGFPFRALPHLFHGLLTIGPGSLRSCFLFFLFLLGSFSYWLVE